MSYPMSYSMSYPKSYHMSYPRFCPIYYTISYSMSHPMSYPIYYSMLTNPITFYMYDSIYTVFNDRPASSKTPNSSPPPRTKTIASVPLSQANSMKNLLAFANIPLQEAKMFKVSLADPGKFEASAQRLALRLPQCTLQTRRVAKEAELFKESHADPGKFIASAGQVHYSDINETAKVHYSDTNETAKELEPEQEEDIWDLFQPLCIS